VFVGNGAVTTIYDIFKAAQSGNVPRVRALINAGTDPNTANHTGGTPLHYTVASGYSVVVDVLLAARADPVKGDKVLCTPLHLAAMKGNTSVLENVFSVGTDVNMGDSNGVRPLYGAAMKGHTRALGILLAAGADPNIKDHDGYTALHLAWKYSHNGAARQLEKEEFSPTTNSKCRPKTRDRDGYLCCEQRGERALANWTCPKCGDLFCIACSGSGERNKNDLGGIAVEKINFLGSVNSCPVCDKPPAK